MYRKGGEIITIKGVAKLSGALKIFTNTFLGERKGEEMKIWKDALPIALIIVLLLEIGINGGAWWKAVLVITFLIYFIVRIIRWNEKWIHNRKLEGG